MVINISIESDQGRRTMSLSSTASAALAFALLVAPAASVRAEDAAVYRISIKEHHFVPDSVTIPANAKVTLIVSNEDATPEEFDSIPLHREKVVPAGKDVTILLGPLKPGSYAFAGEYHEDTAKGTVLVKE
jgi:plastocyanin